MDNWGNWLSVVAPIAGVGALYVVAPVVADTYRRLRGTKSVTCPDNHQPADIEIDAKQAAINAALARSTLQVSRCSRWPEHHECGQACLAEFK